MPIRLPRPFTTLLLAMALLILRASSADAIDFVVDSTVDAADANSGDGLCQTAAGECTLRAAVQEGAGKITLPAGTYTLTNSGGNSLPLIFGGRIVGAGPDRSIIDGPPGTLLLHNSSLASLGLHGSISHAGGFGAGVLTIENAAVSDGTIIPGSGSGLTVRNSTLTNVTMFAANGAQVSINNSRVSGSSIGSSDAGLSIIDSIIENGQHISIHQGALSCTRSTIVNNQGDQGGGVYLLAGGLFADACTITGNTAKEGGGVYFGNSSFGGSLTNSTISDNHATAGDGGGIYVGGFGTLAIENSTISGNTATRHGGGAFTYVAVTFTNATVTGNVADSDADGNGNGGGFYVGAIVTLHLSRTILAGNSTGAGLGPECRTSVDDGCPSCSGPIMASYGYNLLGDLTGCFPRLTPDATDLVGVDPMLGPLQDNGGPTFTRALLAGSPAIDAADACSTPDQRGISRPQGDACDIGAFEYACGNGTVNLGETCDDDNTVDGDCCSANCHIEPCPTVTTTPTSTPAPVETVTPTVVATETAPPAAPSETSTPEATVTPTATATPSVTATPTPTGTSIASPLPTPTLPPVCPPTPQAGCKTPSVAQRSTLVLRDNDLDKRDSLTWQWLKGSPTAKADFGAPNASTSYALCVYDASPAQRLVLSAEVPGGRLCGTRRPKPCWKETKTGFRYSDADGTSDGIHTIVLQEGEKPGKAKIVVSGKGAGLGVPNLAALVPPVVVQLRNNDDHCWEATYSTAASEASKFKGKGP